MRKILLVILVLFPFFLPLLGQQPTERGSKVQFKSIDMTNIPGTDSIILWGDVVLHHNGAIITCDSAVRYGPDKFDCFRRVIINKDSTYVYGEKAHYDKETNTAQVFDHLVKVVDGNATLYTYNFSFNTLNNIGRYWGGGSMLQDSNMLESDRGWYYGDERNMYAKGEVEMTNPDYKLMSDSVRYNMNDEIAEFYTLTHIWNSKGELLKATSGKYFHQMARYDFTSDSYVLTGEQEIWADSIDYNSNSEDVVLRRNIQLRDEDQKVMAFGDYGIYWGASGEGYLTRNPSLVTFDPQEDSLYMRSDTMFVYSIAYELDYKQYDDSVRMARQLLMLEADGITLDKEGNRISKDSLDNVQALADLNRANRVLAESEGQSAPPVFVDSSMVQKIDISTEKAIAARKDVDDSESTDLMKVNGIESSAESQTAEIVEITEEAAVSAGESAEESAEEMTEEAEITVKSPPTRRELREQRRRQNKEEKTVKQEAMNAKARALREAEQLLMDSIKQEGLVEAIETKEIDRVLLDNPGDVTDSISGGAIPDLFPASDTVAVDSITQQRDSLQRIIKAYYNVRIYRNDFQAVCDSMIGFTKDSTLHMYIDPILWNGKNQITAEVIDIYTENKELKRAFFTGDPFMTSQADISQYNQIKGREMEAFFRDNNIFYHKVNGNAQTLYYMLDDESQKPNAFMVINSARIMFVMENQEMLRMTWDESPDYIVYPIDDIPQEVPLFLKGFRWESDRRPTMESVFDRVIRQSQREKYEAMTKPQFPITERIDKHKQRLIDARAWRDRVETLPPYATEFIRSLSIK